MPSNPVVTFKIETPRQAKRTRRNRRFARAAYAAAIAAAMIAPAPADVFDAMTSVEVSAIDAAFL